MEQVYFVTYNFDGPEAIYFDEESAFASGFEYVSIFNSDGMHIQTYKLLDTDSMETTIDNYTTDF